MLMPYLENFNLRQWIEDNKTNWGTRPVRVIWESDDYITMVGRGPTRGKDFHIGPAEEIFYQLEGELHFNYITPQGERKLMVVRAGEMFLLPAKVPHAPRRPNESSLTLVVERKRKDTDLDIWMWFCESCNIKLYETPPRMGAGPSNGPNLVVQEANELLRRDVKLRTCGHCGEILPAPA